MAFLWKVESACKISTLLAARGKLVDNYYTCKNYSRKILLYMEDFSATVRQSKPKTVQI